MRAPIKTNSGKEASALPLRAAAPLELCTGGELLVGVAPELALPLAIDAFAPEAAAELAAPAALDVRVITAAEAEAIAELAATDAESTACEA